jgi:DNA repair exonuclease SbcCD ATPase subunit
MIWGLIMPSISSLESKINRIRSEITRLEAKRSGALRDESNALKKINRASKITEIERENNKIKKAREEQAKAANEISKKNIELNKTVTELGKTQQKEQEKLFAEQEHKIKELYSVQKSELENMVAAPSEKEEIKEYDIFISHSANDKDSYVSDLVEALKAENISIWYDSDNIGWGQSIRQEIDKGLANSNYGIVVISSSFIEKYWTNYMSISISLNTLKTIKNTCK